MTYDAACLLRTRFENVQNQLQAKVHIKFVACFCFKKSCSSFVIFNDFLYFTYYLAAQQVPTDVECFIFVPNFEASSS
jgi:hypothetical protein